MNRLIYILAAVLFSWSFASLTLGTTIVHWTDRGVITGVNTEFFSDTDSEFNLFPGYWSTYVDLEAPDIVATFAAQTSDTIITDQLYLTGYLATDVRFADPSIGNSPFLNANADSYFSLGFQVTDNPVSYSLTTTEYGSALSELRDTSNWNLLADTGILSPGLYSLYFQVWSNSSHSVGYSDISFTFSTSSVQNNEFPEPTTMILFGAGLAGIVGARFRRK